MIGKKATEKLPNTMRELIFKIKNKNEGILLLGDVGISSHFRDF